MKVDKSKWEKKRLGEVCDVLNGLWKGKKAPFINVGVIRNTNFTKNCQLDLNDVAYLEVEQKQFQNRKLQKGDIIIEKSGGGPKQPVGRAVLFNEEDGNYSFSNFTSTLRLKNNKVLMSFYLHKYLYYFYVKGGTVEMQNHLTGIHNLDFKQYKNISIPVPPLSEQQAIASELDAIQSLITKYDEQLNDYDNLAKSIFNEMFGDVVSNDKGWERKKISDVCDTSAGGTPNKSVQSYYLNGNIPWLRSGEITQMIISNTEIMITKSGLDNSSAKIFPKNTIVVAMYGATAGQVGILNFECSTNQAICGILPNDNISTVFMYYVLVLMKKKLIENASGSAQPNISQQKIKSLSIILPPLPLQQKFAARITAIESQKDEVKQQIADLQTLFDSRMQYYFD